VEDLVQALLSNAWREVAHKQLALRLELLLLLSVLLIGVTAAKAAASTREHVSGYNEVCFDSALKKTKLKLSGMSVRVQLLMFAWMRA
jgi:hypothetical protein